MQFNKFTVYHHRCFRFNEEDDFEDVPTDTKADLDNSISKSSCATQQLKQIDQFHTQIAGKIMDKKSDLLNGPKSLYQPVVTLQQQQQLPSAQTIVNSTNNNNSVSNNNRKSSETVTTTTTTTAAAAAATTSSPSSSSTSSTEEDVAEEEESEQQQQPKSQVESPEITDAAKALAAALGDEEPDTSIDEPALDEIQLLANSDNLNVDSSNKEEEEEEEPSSKEAAPAAAATADDGAEVDPVKDTNLKKVSCMLLILIVQVVNVQSF